MPTRIDSGIRLGPYEIVSRIGAGGMGEVWRARDTRLDRQVAIKVLPDALAENEHFRARFEREAKSISQLNHPNICTLYDVGHENGTSYLVMELLEGESLADRLVRGPLPLGDVIRYGAQIAAALDRAHRAGIVHRDLKPGNVVITKSGAKLLDFGLAKSASSPIVVSIDGATEHRPLTQEGTILGTFQYMAPEQLEGQEADPRTDIFSLGAVLHEMATGKRTFDGKTKTSLIAAIVNSTPRPLSELLPLSPPALDHVIAKCLEKDPDDRWQSAHDVASELLWISGGSGQAAAVQFPRRRRNRLLTSVTVAAAVAIGALGAWGILHWRAPGMRITRTSIVTPAEAPIAVYGASRVAISPDGRVVAYVAIHAGTRQIYLRRIDSLESLPLTGSEGAVIPFFSPDSESIGFADGKHLRRSSITGGPAQTITDAVDVRWATWTSDGTIVFARGTEGLFSVPSEGGSPRALIQNGPVLSPEQIPDSDSILTVDGRGSIFAVPRNGGRSKQVYAGPDEINAAVYVAPGYIVFDRGRALFAAPFDAKRLELTGSPRMIVDNVTVIPPFTMPLFSASSNGTLVYVPGMATFASATLLWVDRKGTETPIASTPRPFEDPRLSPDGARIAVTCRDRNADVWIEDAARGVLTRFTFDAQEEETAVWSPDGKWIAYTAQRDKTHGVYMKAADGSGTEQELAMTKSHAHAGSWAPDGSSFVYTDYTREGGGDIWTVALGGSHQARAFLQTPFNERAPRVSPDGHWIAYTSDESGRDEVYVQSYPTPGAKFQISVDGGAEGVWSPLGDEMFYRHGDAMMAVPVVVSPAFSARNPALLFQGQYVPTRRGEAAYDVSPDGKRFLMVRRDAQSSPTQIVVVANFLSELKAAR